MFKAITSFFAKEKIAKKSIFSIEYDNAKDEFLKLCNELIKQKHTLDMAAAAKHDKLAANKLLILLRLDEFSAEVQKYHNRQPPYINPNDAENIKTLTSFYLDNVEFSPDDMTTLDKYRERAKKIGYLVGTGAAKFAGSTVATLLTGPIGGIAVSAATTAHTLSDDHFTLHAATYKLVTDLRNLAETLRTNAEIEIGKLNYWRDNIIQLTPPYQPPSSPNV